MFKRKWRVTVIFSETRIRTKMSSFELFLSTWEYFKDFSCAVKNIEDLVNELCSAWFWVLCMLQLLNRIWEVSTGKLNHLDFFDSYSV